MCQRLTLRYRAVYVQLLNALLPVSPPGRVGSPAPSPTAAAMLKRPQIAVYRLSGQIGDENLHVVVPMASTATIKAPSHNGESIATGAGE